ncbi:MAG: D-2-hydroxyacid dehydrogenase [Bacteroidetes bacterium]|nr:D-2-hydroxyacid dehydrogenase [Bacteroidota bacterium]
MRVLANDGIDAAGKSRLEAAGFEVITDKIAQADLPSRIGEYDIIIVRSATRVTAEVMDGGNLKLIARAGVGLDNIDLKHTGLKNIPVVNTPNASSRSVAELVFAHILTGCRYLHTTNREMPADGVGNFNSLKKLAGGGIEVQGKKLGIIGFGRIGQEVAKMAVGLGMEVLVNDYREREFELTITLNKSYQQHNFKVVLTGQNLPQVLSQADFVTIHTPGSDEVLGAEQLSMMKKGAVLVNCARGGVVNEPALVELLKSGHISFAGVDVFESEPPIYTDILRLPNVSLSPHIGASTAEAQERVGLELADRILTFFK